MIKRKLYDGLKTLTFSSYGENNILLNSLCSFINYSFHHSKINTYLQLAIFM